MLSGLATASADEVTDEIDRAKVLYEEGKIAEAKEALDFASQLVAQQKAGLLGDVLPDPFDGWSVDDGESSAANIGMFGGGISASRTYRKDDAECNVSVVGDSPMMSMLTMMFANPAMAGASGAKVQRVAGQRALVTKEGEVQVVTPNSYLVSVDGSCAEADKLGYAGGVDYETLNGF